MSALANFSEWLKTAWTDFLTWFDTEEQQIASFLYPIFQDAKVLVQEDLLGDIIDGVPIVAAAITGATGTLPEILTIAETAAKDFLLPLLEKQGVTLEQTTVNTLANALVAQAQAATTSSHIVATDATAGTGTTGATS